ncbi:MAG: tetraacyldisaccharide 4'-kinase [Cyclobacteriaceae bacterium]|nr:tetraacyldisaccharide 4'-kinase [Cyclobacteriaceae bacterium HetDA_MAG_MS6]
MSWWQLLLFPFSILYNLITRFRNHLYNIGHFPSIRFDANVISIGNLDMGGTGKTPMVEYMANYLIREGKKLAILSRGYGRKTSGFRIAGNSDSANTLGDEPFGFYAQFRDEVTVAVGERRALAIPEILFYQPDTEVIILDDAFQHRSVTPNLNILLTTFQKPFFHDYLIPSGRLREGRVGSKRADTIIVTKCPKTISEDDKEEIKSQVNRYNLKASVYFTSTDYGDLIGFSDKPIKKNKIILVAGIANPDAFFDHMRQQYNVVQCFSFTDHYRYREKDIQSICKSAVQHNAMIITTQKDMVKLQTWGQLMLLSAYYQPITVHFLEHEAKFQQMILSKLTNYSNINQ